MKSSFKFGLVLLLLGIGIAGFFALQNRQGTMKDPLAGEILPIESTLTGGVKQITFTNGETTEPLAPSAWNVVFVPNDDSVLTGVNFRELFTPGTNVFGYEYTSQDAATEFYEKQLYPTGQGNNFLNLYPGKFFASDSMIAHDPTLIAFKQRHSNVTIRPLSSMTLDKNARYVIRTTDADTILRVRDEPSFDCVPSLPSIVGSTSLDYSPYDFTVSGNFAYLTFTNNQSVAIVDISNPENPSVTSTVSSIGIQSRVAVQGNYIYATNGGRYGDHAGFEIFDVSNPIAPTYVGKYDRETVYSDQIRANTPYSDIAVSGNYTYVANGGHGFQVINITNPAHPVLAKAMEFPLSVNNYKYMSRLAIVGNMLYGWGDTGGFHIFDITDPLHPVWKSQWTPDDLGWSGNLQTITFADHYAYVALHDMGGVMIVDTADSSHPLYLGTYVSNRPRKPDGTDDYGGSNGFDIGMFPAVVGNTIYMLSNPLLHSYLEVGDLRHPSRPLFVAGQRMNDLTYGVNFIVQDSNAYTIGQYSFYSFALHCD